jgi:hypothetical protein
VGYRMLTDVSDFVTDNWQPARDALDVAEADLADAIAAEADTTAAEAALDVARAEFDLRNAQLNEKTQIIDFVAYLGEAMEYGR